jgi:hypothetical protein
MRWKNLNQGHENRISALSAMPPHERLGVPPDASPEEVKAAYSRALVPMPSNRRSPARSSRRSRRNKICALLGVEFDSRSSLSSRVFPMAMMLPCEVYAYRLASPIRGTNLATEAAFRP